MVLYPLLILSLMLQITPSAGDPPTREEILAVARSAYVPGTFEIYYLPGPHCMVAGGSTWYPGWESHIPVGEGFSKTRHEGSNHGGMWDYDTRVPMMLSWPGRVEPGVDDSPVSLEDLGPTIASILGMQPFALSPGKVLSGLKPGKAPRIVALVVLDAVGSWVLEDHLAQLPFLSALRDQGRRYDNARLTYGISGTSVSHAVIGTSVLPRYNGVTDNEPFYPDLGRQVTIYGDDLDLVNLWELRAPTFADAWDRETGGKALVLAYSSASRAVVGMAGHGSYLEGGDKDMVFWLSEDATRFTTDDRYFSLPPGLVDPALGPWLEKLNAPDPVWGHQTCEYGAQKPYTYCLRGSPAFVAMEGEMLSSVLSSLPDLGKDEVTDLVLINFKSGDYCGHYLGAESLECRRSLVEVDTQLARVHRLLKAASHDDLALFVVADHGIAPLKERSGGVHLKDSSLRDLLQARFDKDQDDRPVVLSVRKAYLNLDLRELADNRATIEEVRDFLKDLKVDGRTFFQEVFTYKEIDPLAELKGRRP